MNTNTEAEFEYRVMVLAGKNGRWFNAYGTRAYPSLGTARGLASQTRRHYPDNHVRIEKRPVFVEWEVVE